MEVDTNVKGACEKFYMMGLFQNLLITEVASVKESWQRGTICKPYTILSCSGHSRKLLAEEISMC